MQQPATSAKKKVNGHIRSFSPALVLDWFSADRLELKESARFLAKLLHPADLNPAGPHCRKCGELFTNQRRIERFYRFERIQCPKCRTFSTAATGTIIHKSEFEPREIILLAVGFELKLSDKQIAKLLACSTETVRTWRLKFKALNDK
jgi:phage FluMu protein Com